GRAPSRPGVREHQRARRALAGDAPLQHALSLERLQVIEGRPRGESEAVSDLPYGWRHAVALGKRADELQDFSLSQRELSHPSFSSRALLPPAPRAVRTRDQTAIIVNTR